MSPLLPLGLGIGALLLLLRQKASLAVPSTPAPTAPAPAQTPLAEPAAPAQPSVQAVPEVKRIQVEDRTYTVTRYGGGIYKVELMGPAGPVAAISFGQSGPPIRTGDAALIDKYIMTDIHNFPPELFTPSGEQ